MAKIKVVYKTVGEMAEIIEVEDKLETYQSLVGGYIEAVNLPHDIVMIVNETGKLNMMDNNFNFISDNKILDVIVGNVFFIGSSGENFSSLTDDQISLLGSMFYNADTFISV